MPVVNLPRVPDGLRDLMKSLTREVLREKPENIYEFSAQYFESKLDKKNEYIVKSFEPVTILEIGTRTRQELPLSLVYTIIPQGLTELIKDFIKAVLRENPSNLCEFAVQYFRNLQNLNELQNSIRYTEYENYIGNKERFSFTPYLNGKCICGRTIRTNNKDFLYNENVSNFPQNFEAKNNHSDKHLITTTIYTTNEKSIDTHYGEKYVKAVYIIQRFLKRCYKMRRDVRNVAYPSDISKSNEVQYDKMSVETAAFIIQRSLRKLLKKNRLQKQMPTNTVNMLKLEPSNHNEETNDNASEAASYTSASTVLMSAESLGEYSDMGIANYEEGVLQETIIEDEETDNDHSNISQNASLSRNKRDVSNILDGKIPETNKITQGFHENNELENKNVIGSTEIESIDSLTYKNVSQTKDIASLQENDKVIYEKFLKDVPKQITNPTETPQLSNEQMNNDSTATDEEDRESNMKPDVTIETIDKEYETDNNKANDNENLEKSLMTEDGFINSTTGELDGGEMKTTETENNTDKIDQIEQDFELKGHKLETEESLTETTKQDEEYNLDANDTLDLKGIEKLIKNENDSENAAESDKPGHHSEISNKADDKNDVSGIDKLHNEDLHNASIETVTEEKINENQKKKIKKSLDDSTNYLNHHDMLVEEKSEIENQTQENKPENKEYIPINMKNLPKELSEQDGANNTDDMRNEKFHVKESSRELKKITNQDNNETAFNDIENQNRSNEKSADEFMETDEKMDKKFLQEPNRTEGISEKTENYTENIPKDDTNIVAEDDSAEYGEHNTIIGEENYTDPNKIIENAETESNENIDIEKSNGNSLEANTDKALTKQASEEKKNKPENEATMEVQNENKSSASMEESKNYGNANIEDSNKIENQCITDEKNTDVADMEKFKKSLEIDQPAINSSRDQPIEHTIIEELTTPDIHRAQDNENNNLKVKIPKGSSLQDILNENKDENEIFDQIKHENENNETRTIADDSTLNNKRIDHSLTNNSNTVESENIESEDIVSDQFKSQTDEDLFNTNIDSSSIDTRNTDDELEEHKHIKDSNSLENISAELGNSKRLIENNIQLADIDINNEMDESLKTNNEKDKILDDNKTDESNLENKIHEDLTNHEINKPQEHENKNNNIVASPQSKMNSLESIATESKTERTVLIQSNADKDAFGNNNNTVKHSDSLKPYDEIGEDKIIDSQKENSFEPMSTDSKNEKEVFESISAAEAEFRDNNSDDEKQTENPLSVMSSEPKMEKKDIHQLSTDNIKSLNSEDKTDEIHNDPATSDNELRENKIISAAKENSSETITPTPQNEEKYSEQINAGDIKYGIPSSENEDVHSAKTTDDSKETVIRKEICPEAILDKHETEKKILDESNSHAVRSLNEVDNVKQKNIQPTQLDDEIQEDSNIVNQDKRNLNGVSAKSEIDKNVFNNSNSDETINQNSEVNVDYIQIKPTKLDDEIQNDKISDTLKTSLTEHETEKELVDILSEDKDKSFNIEVNTENAKIDSFPADNERDTDAENKIVNSLEDVHEKEIKNETPEDSLNSEIRKDLKEEEMSKKGTNKKENSLECGTHNESLDQNLNITDGINTTEDISENSNFDQTFSDLGNINLNDMKYSKTEILESEDKKPEISITKNLVTCSDGESKKSNNDTEEIKLSNNDIVGKDTAESEQLIVHRNQEENKNQDEEDFKVDQKDTEINRRNKSEESDILAKAEMTIASKEKDYKDDHFTNEVNINKNSEKKISPHISIDDSEDLQLQRPASKTNILEVITAKTNEDTNKSAQSEGVFTENKSELSDDELNVENELKLLRDWADCQTDLEPKIMKSDLEDELSSFEKENKEHPISLKNNDSMKTENTVDTHSIVQVNDINSKLIDENSLENQNQSEKETRDHIQVTENAAVHHPSFEEENLSDEQKDNTTAKEDFLEKEDVKKLENNVKTSNHSNIAMPEPISVELDETKENDETTHTNQLGGISESTITNTLDIDNLTPESNIGTVNSHNYSNKIGSSENVSENTLNLQNSEVNPKYIKENIRTNYAGQITGPLMAEVHLKSFTLNNPPEAGMRGFPWTNENNVESSTNIGKKIPQENTHNDITLEDNQKSINLGMEENKINAETNIGPDRHMNGNKTAEEPIIKPTTENNRTATYLYGIHTALKDLNQTQKDYKPAEAFTIPFHDPKVMLQETTDSKILPANDDNTFEQYDDDFPKYTEVQGNESVVLDENENKVNDEILDSETPTKLFNELEAFDFNQNVESSPDMAVTYTAEEAMSLLLNNPSSTLHTIVEQNENETPRSTKTENSKRSSVKLQLDDTEKVTETLRNDKLVSDAKIELIDSWSPTKRLNENVNSEETEESEGHSRKRGKRSIDNDFIVSDKENQKTNNDDKHELKEIPQSKPVAANKDRFMLEKNSDPTNSEIKMEEEVNKKALSFDETQPEILKVDTSDNYTVNSKNSMNDLQEYLAIEKAVMNSQPHNNDSNLQPLHSSVDVNKTDTNSTSVDITAETRNPLGAKNLLGEEKIFPAAIEETYIEKTTSKSDIILNQNVNDDLTYIKTDEELNYEFNKNNPNQIITENTEVPAPIKENVHDRSFIDLVDENIKTDKASHPEGNENILKVLNEIPSEDTDVIILENDIKEIEPITQKSQVQNIGNDILKKIGNLVVPKQSNEEIKISDTNSYDTEHINETINLAPASCSNLEPENADLLDKNNEQNLGKTYVKENASYPISENRFQSTNTELISTNTDKKLIPDEENGYLLEVRTPLKEEQMLAINNSDMEFKNADNLNLQDNELNLGRTYVIDSISESDNTVKNINTELKSEDVDINLIKEDEERKDKNELLIDDTGSNDLKENLNEKTELLIDDRGSNDLKEPWTLLQERISSAEKLISETVFYDTTQIDYVQETLQDLKNSANELNNIESLMLNAPTPPETPPGMTDAVNNDFDLSQAEQLENRNKAAIVIQKFFKNYLKAKKNGPISDNSINKNDTTLNKRPFENNDSENKRNIAAAVIQTVFKNYMKKKARETENKLSKNNSWNDSYVTEIYVGTDLGDRQNEDSKSLSSLEFKSDTFNENDNIVQHELNNMEPTAPTEAEVMEEDAEKVKVNWFVGNVPIKPTDYEYSRNEESTKRNSISSDSESSLENDACDNNLSKSISAPDLLATKKVDSTGSLLTKDSTHIEDKFNNSTNDIQNNGDYKNLTHTNILENSVTESAEHLEEVNKNSRIQSTEVELGEKLKEGKENEHIQSANVADHVSFDTNQVDDNVPKTTEKAEEEENIHQYTINSDLIQKELDFLNSERNFSSTSIPYTRFKTTDEEVESTELKSQTSELSNDVDTSTDDAFEAVTEKLDDATVIISRMQQRRASETLINTGDEKLKRETSFDEPIIKSMQELQEQKSTDVEDDDIIIMEDLQREETRESSAQSDSVVFGTENLQDIEIVFGQDDTEIDVMPRASLKRLYTIAGEDPKTLFKSVTIDETIKYIDPTESDETLTSGNSFCLDDDTSENIRKKMMAYSLSDADSDFYESSADFKNSSIEKSKFTQSDFNVSTALMDTTGTSTETESTIVSAATKIQAGARGFITRRRLRRASAGTKSSIQDYSLQDDNKASFGNDAISESLEKFVEDEAAKKIQSAYRSHLRKINKKIRNDRDLSSLPTTSMENTLAARRLTLQRGDALRNDSTPDEDNGSSSNGKPIKTRNKVNTKDMHPIKSVVLSNKSNTAAAASNADRIKKISDNKLKWLAMRQNSMPVQIDSEVFRVIPKHMRKRNKSAESEKKIRRRVLYD
ncbi:protein PF14_0175 [Teleopsis dalmanni]|uniref:protein PF14_0175 n=1 Tax=Teleopsis dalmanni TaxID=139649 RepID=UPI0018CE25B8|nr:protein PF14_0175 [Teleopsis dalmanni]